MNLPTHLKASVYMVAAMAAFVVNDTLVKLTANRLPVGEIIALRGALATLIIAVVCWRAGHWASVPQIATRDVSLRAVLDLMGTVFFVTALMHMPIANLTAILQAVPLLVTALGAMILGERVGWRRTLAIAVGLAGVMLVVKPSPTDISPWELLGLACVISVSVRDIVTRRIHVAVPSLVIALANAGFVAAGGFAIMAVEGFVMPSLADALRLAGAAVFLGVGYMFMVRTLRLGDLASTAPARYTIVLFSLVSGMLVFAEFPDEWAILGIALIVASGFYAVRREARLKRLALAQSPAE